MDKELTIQDLEAQADALLAAADEMEELLPADTGKSKRKKADASCWVLHTANRTSRHSILTGSV